MGSLYWIAHFTLNCHDFSLPAIANVFFRQFFGNKRRYYDFHPHAM